MPDVLRTMVPTGLSAREETLTVDDEEQQGVILTLIDESETWEIVLSPEARQAINDQLADSHDVTAGDA